MTYLTPQEAFALALIRRTNLDSAKLVNRLDGDARRIADEFVKKKKTGPINIKVGTTKKPA